MLQLERPLVMFDVETTGTSPTQDRIVQMAVIKVMPDGTTEEYEWMVNPECAIPEGAQAIHGISDEDVRCKPPFKALANEILMFLKDCDLGGYNAAKFDVPLLCNEFKRVDIEFSLEGVTIVDPFVIFKVLEPKTLAKAYEYYCDKTLEGAHSALPDTRATLEVLQAQAKFYEKMPKTLSKMMKYCLEKKKKDNFFDDEGKLVWINEDLVINFGKYKGHSLKVLVLDERSYLEWVVCQDFTDDVKKAIRDSLSGTFPKRET